MQPKDLPIHQFDRTGLPKVTPSMLVKPHPRMPQRCVLCFFGEAVTHLGRRAEVVTRLKLTAGQPPVLAVRHAGQRVGVVQPGNGAPMAAVTLEELIALGARQFIAVGDAGVLVEGASIVLAEAAIRDEGTSYHYLPPDAATVHAHPHALDALRAALTEANIGHRSGLTWTTDAPFRETTNAIERAVGMGGLTVEMEAAALYAVARHRGVPIAQVLGGSDDLSGERWAWLPGREPLRLKLARAAVDAAARL